MTVAPELLKAFSLEQRIVTGDALDCQRAFCRRIVAGGGASFFAVKEHQPNLHDDLFWLFAWPAPGERLAEAVEYGQHGDRTETRRLWATPALTGYSDWPGLRQVCQIERRVVCHGNTSVETAYAVTSLGPEAAPAQLLTLWRGHWAIENRRHYVRDVTFGEDACQARSGAAPEVLAALRNVVLGLLRQAGYSHIAAALRQLAWQPGAALRLLGIQTL